MHHDVSYAVCTRCAWLECLSFFVLANSLICPCVDGIVVCSKSTGGRTWRAGKSLPARRFQVSQVRFSAETEVTQKDPFGEADINAALARPYDSASAAQLSSAQKIGWSLPEAVPAWTSLLFHAHQFNRHGRVESRTASRFVFERWSARDLANNTSSRRIPIRCLCQIRNASWLTLPFRHEPGRRRSQIGDR